MNQPRTVLALDIGGTKVAAAAISEAGEIQAREEANTNLTQGPEGFINDVSTVAKSILKQVSCKNVGIASAGPLDPINGTLIQPTNIKDGNSWGTIELVKHLESSLSLECTLENDAACAILGEAWLGKAQDKSSAMVITLGTGVGVGAISNGQLVRLRNSFHPEASHFSLNFTDKLAQCGCGNTGCVEAYLGGKNFTHYANARWELNCKNGKELVELARSRKDSKAIAAFEFYAEVMAQALTAYSVLFAPEIVIFSGGFSHATDLFLSSTKFQLKELLKDRREGLDFLPELCVSDKQDSIGLLGAARVALKAPARY